MYSVFVVVVVVPKGVYGVVVASVGYVANVFVYDMF